MTELINLIQTNIADTAFNPLQDLTPLSPPANIYYRSRVFTSETGINSLIRLLQPLLSFLARLSLGQQLKQDESAQDNLFHEIRTFESRSMAHCIDSEIILMARYLITTAICESLTDLPNTEWCLNALTRQYPEINQKKLFSNMLHLINQQPKKYVELLELAYISITLGMPKQTRLLDHLFRQIRDIRGDISLRLFFNPQRNKKRSYLPMRWLAGITVMIILGIYGGYSYFLQLSTHMLPGILVASHQTSTKAAHHENL